MPERLRQLEQWLRQSCRLHDFSLAPASADASFRRYFRVTLADGGSRIAMDAPPAREDCRPFVAMARRMHAAGLHVPTIHAEDLDQGFLLLEDLGSRSYLDALNDASVDGLYTDATTALLRLQARAPAQDLPPYDRAMLMREMALLPEWLLGRHLGMSLGAQEQAMLDQAFELLADNALEQPQVFVHRDYHSRNLMVVDADNPGVIDFQDAVYGPVTYDLVSLLRDCYIEWPGSQVDRWVGAYHEAACELGVIEDVDASRFLTWFDLMGVQRHLKAAGIFARLLHRDGKPGYLADIPRTLRYIVAVGRRRSSIAPLARFLDGRVLPALVDAGDVRRG